MKDKKILRMVQLSFFIAIIVVLQVIAYVLSRFTLLPFSLSLVFLPIVLGAAVFLYILIRGARIQNSTKPKLFRRVRRG